MSKEVKPASIGKAKAKSGPKPDTLKLSIKWTDAVKKSLEKKKSPEGWPK